MSDLRPLGSREQLRPHLPVLEQPLRVFFISTWEDLQPERERVRDFIRGCPDLVLAGMGFFGARNESSPEGSSGAVDCDVCVGIVGLRYGYGVSAAEYLRAYAPGAKCLFYLRSAGREEVNFAQDSDPDAYAAAVELRSELRRVHAVQEFVSADELASLVARDLSRIVLERHAATTGGRARSAGPATAIDLADRTALEHFITEHLGPPGTPRSFAGRDKELAALDKWLADDEAPACALLSAPAGRGKSVLLVHWTQRVDASGRAEVVFVPVSVRYGTSAAFATFSILAGQLARLHGDPAPSLATTPEVLQALASDYLRRPLSGGRRLLVVLDGLDEAAGWDLPGHLFPTDGPNGLRVLLSARPGPNGHGPTGRVFPTSWDVPGTAFRIALDPLNPEALAALVHEAGLAGPKDPTGWALAGELARVTKGDPLLASLYIEGFKERRTIGERVSPADLADAAPGLEEYLKGWRVEQGLIWSTVRDPVDASLAELLLALFACARGPLRRADLFALLPPEPAHSGLRVERALRSLSRLVAGDAEEQGYVFAHPRLADHYRALLSPSERELWEERLLNWAERTVATLARESLKPGDVPPYLVRHLGVHLEQANVSPAMFAPLVSEAWRQAWEALEPGGAGFLMDVERCWRATEDANLRAVVDGELAPFLALQVSCALAHASVIDASKSLPPTLVVELARTGVWTWARARAVAKSRPEAAVRASLLIDLVTTDADASLDCAREAMEAVKELPALAERASLLLRLADVAGLRKWNGLWTECLLEAEGTVATAPVATVWDRVQRAELLALLALRAAPDRTGSFGAESLAVALALNDDETRVEALLRVAPHLPEPLRAVAEEEALRSEALLPGGFGRPAALQALLNVLRGPRRDEAMRQGLQVARGGATRALGVLLPWVTETERESILRERLPQLEANTYDASNVALALELVPYLAVPWREGVLSALLATQPEVFDEAYGLDVAAPLERLVELGHEEEAARLALKMSRRHNFSGIIPALARHPASRAATAFTAPAVAAVLRRTAQERIDALQSLAPLLPPDRYGTLLCDTLEELLGPGVGSTADLADAFQHYSNALDSSSEERPLRVLPSSFYRGASALIERTLIVKPASLKIRASLKQSALLDDELRQRALETVLGEVRGEVDPEVRTLLFLQVMPELQHPLLQQTFDECLASARSINRQGARAEVLARLAEWVTRDDASRLMAEARALLPEVRYRSFSEELLAPVVTRLAAFGMDDWSLRMVSAVPDPFERGTLLALLLYFSQGTDADLVRSEAVGELRSTLESVDTVERRVWLLLFAAVCLPERDRTEIAAQAEAAINEVEGPGLRSAMFLALVPCAGSESRERLIAECLSEFDSFVEPHQWEDPLASPEVYVRTAFTPNSLMAAGTRVLATLIAKDIYGDIHTWDYTASELLLTLHQLRPLPSLRSSRDQLHGDWCEILRDLSGIGRATLTVGLAPFADIAVTLGGHVAAAEIADELRRAARDV